MAATQGFRISMSRHAGSCRLVPATVCSMLLVLCLCRLEAAWPSTAPGSASCSSTGSSADASVVPDCFRQPQDGDDDAPSINRAIVALTRSRHNQLVFLARIYLLKSPVTQRDVELHWVGAGWSEPATPVRDRAHLGCRGPSKLHAGHSDRLGEQGIDHRKHRRIREAAGCSCARHLETRILSLLLSC